MDAFSSTAAPETKPESWSWGSVWPHALQRVPSVPRPPPAPCHLPGGCERCRAQGQPTASKFPLGLGCATHGNEFPLRSTSPGYQQKIIIPAPTAAERQSQQNPWLLAVPRQYEWWVYLVLLRWVFFVLTKCCSPRAAGLTCLIPSTASRVPHVSAQPTTATKPRGAPGPGEGSATAAPAQPHSQPTEPRAARSWLRAELGAPQLPPLLKRQH